mgnify:CR=1 FL=1
MIIVQNHYFAAPGHHEQVLATRREANACRARLGLRAGNILVRTRGADRAPDVIWQITYPDIAAWEADLAFLEASPEFTAIRQRQSAQLRHFERCAFILDGNELYPLADETAPTIT